jgi:hypothetical protein
MVDVPRCKLDLNDLTTGIVDMRANDETLGAAVSAVVNGNDVTSLLLTIPVMSDRLFLIQAIHIWMLT